MTAETCSGAQEMNTLKTPEEVRELMKSATSESDWNDKCDQVKKANGGYPDFWYSTIILSGVLAETQAQWQK